MKSFEPKISIIIPNYNRGDLLVETLNSVLRQDYQNWEAIIIDDGSTDNSIQVGTEYANKDQRVSIFSRKVNPGGAPVCRNIGLKKSTGEFVIFLDSDDILADYCLSQRVKTIEKDPNNSFWVFPMWVFSKNINQAQNIWNIETPQSDISRFLSLDAVWQTSGPIWRKDAAQKIGGFTEGLACWQDVDIHLKALTAKLPYKKYYSMPADIYYRQHETGSISQGEISSLPKLQSRVKILQSHYKNINTKSDDIITGFSIMAGNIAIGSARTLHSDITKQVLKFGIENKLLDKNIIFDIKFIQKLVLSRLNRIKVVNKLILKRIKMYQHDSNIGKHSPKIM